MIIGCELPLQRDVAADRTPITDLREPEYTAFLTGGSDASR